MRCIREPAKRNIPWLLSRQRLHELDHPFGPVFQRVIVLDAFRLACQPIPYRAAGHVELPKWWLQHGFFVIVPAESGKESIPPDTEKCVGVHWNFPGMVDTQISL